ncbi:MAG TPA: hypothetical protein PL152_04975 [Steroidobacteraceae bacterium]|nr:hypothetical protein [Steroidobacteraceae bacterium]
MFVGRSYPTSGPASPQVDSGAARVDRAARLSGARQLQLGPTATIKTQWEEIIIERSGGKQDTSLVVVSSTVMGITVKVHED